MLRGGGLGKQWEESRLYDRYKFIYKFISDPRELDYTVKTPHRRKMVSSYVRFEYLLPLVDILPTDWSAKTGEPQRSELVFGRPTWENSASLKALAPC
jgi:hypothetical protein